MYSRVARIKNPMLGKRIFDLFPIEKKLVRPYQALCRHFGFWPKRGSTAQKFSGGTIFFNQYNVLGHSKKMAAAGGAGKLYSGALIKPKS